MKLLKQIAIVAAFSSPTPHYKAENGHIYWLCKGQWRQLRGNTLPTGYNQMIIAGISVYKHIAVYLAGTLATYPVGNEIDHIDRDKTNTSFSNLRCVTPIVNHGNKRKRSVNNEWRTIRSAEIQDIKRLIGEGMSQANIARTLDLNRLSVRYTIKQIEAGKPLKYER